MNFDIWFIVKISRGFLEHFHGGFVKVCKTNEFNRTLGLCAEKFQRGREQNLGATRLRETKDTAAYGGNSHAAEKPGVTLRQGIVHGRVQAVIFVLLASFPYWA